MITIAFPQILFLGNGLNLAYSGISWSDLVGKIAKRDDFAWSRSEMPMPRPAILASDNQIRTSLKTAKEDFRGKIRNEQQMDVLRDLLTMGFDDILTTNYSYELEEAALGKYVLNDRQVVVQMLRLVPVAFPAVCSPPRLFVLARTVNGKP